jgi:hypothetical protein
MFDGDGPGHYSVLSAVMRKMSNFRVRNLILARHASDVGTGATNPASLHDGGPVPRAEQREKRQAEADKRQLQRPL